MQRLTVLRSLQLHAIIVSKAIVLAALGKGKVVLKGEPGRPTPFHFKVLKQSACGRVMATNAPARRQGILCFLYSTRRVEDGTVSRPACIDASVPWGFTQRGDPNIDPKAVGSPQNKDPKKVPPSCRKPPPCAYGRSLVERGHRSDGGLHAATPDSGEGGSGIQV